MASEIMRNSDEKFHQVIAHVRPVESGGWLTQDLRDHLEGTATRAATFASTFGASDWATLAGFWHDLGKYKEDFQSYIRQSSGYDCHLAAPCLHVICSIMPPEGLAETSDSRMPLIGADVDGEDLGRVLW